jgi:hypothetical protein
MAKAHPKDCKCKDCEQLLKFAQMSDEDIEASIKNISLKNAPKKIGGDLSGKDIQLKSLKGVSLNKESVAITGFIKTINEKNFAKANKYLQLAIREKIKDKIRQCAGLKPF